MNTTTKPQTDQECPICKSDQIEGLALNVENSQISQGMHCLDCGSEWANVYQFSHTEEIYDYSAQRERNQ